MSDDLQCQWIAAMGAHDLQRAWQINDQLLQIAMPGDKHCGPRHRQRIWRGEPFDGGRVLVRCYHGLGDTLQFIRFAKPMRRVAREVIVWCQPELLDLVRRVSGVDRALPLHDGTIDAAFDVDAEIMEIPYALRLSSDDLGADVPYLRCAAPESPRCDGPLRVGLNWTAGEWDPKRRIDAGALALLRSVPGVVFYSLHSDCRSQVLPLVHSPSSSIESLATFMTSLDLIITVDTMTAHLAGGLGLPVWTLLRSECDWRWGETGCSTPWYPTMRLFRQTIADDWTRPMSDIATRLRACARSVGAEA